MCVHASDFCQENDIVTEKISTNRAVTMGWILATDPLWYKASVYTVELLSLDGLLPDCYLQSGCLFVIINHFLLKAMTK